MSFPEVLPNRPSDAGPESRDEDPKKWDDFIYEAEDLLRDARRSRKAEDVKAWRVALIDEAMQNLEAAKKELAA